MRGMRFSAIPLVSDRGQRRLQLAAHFGGESFQIVTARDFDHRLRIDLDGSSYQLEWFGSS